MTTTATKSRPILFSGPMVRAILDGRKTQTRRVVKGVDPTDSLRVEHDANDDPFVVHISGDNRILGEVTCPYGQPGDELWVRETWAPSLKAPKCQFAYSADGRCYGVGDNGDGGYMHIFHGWLVDSKVRGEQPGGTLGRGLYDRWRPSIHMPRWASRITLTVKAVSVERLQDISEGDAAKEGLPRDLPDYHLGAARKKWFVDLWQSINGPDSWAANPWVWVLDFERKKPG